MLNISDETKELYLSTSVPKSLTISIPDMDLVLTNENILSESLQLTECISGSDTVDFTGCISSIFKIKVVDLEEMISGHYIEVDMDIEGSEETLPLFKGYVDTVTNPTHEDTTCEITAYDSLYLANNKDITQWYSTLTFPITIKDLRDGLFEELQIVQEDVILPNDDVALNKAFPDNTIIYAGTLLKGICQLNARFGIIGRDGLFKYVKLEPYGDETTDTISRSYYSKVKYEPYRTAPITEVDIWGSHGKVGTYGEDNSNIFHIMDNQLAFGIPTENNNEVGNLMAENILNEINSELYDFRFTPSKITLLSRPYLECGDSVQLDTNKRTVRTYILKRKITGIQALKDDFESQSEQFLPNYEPSVSSQLAQQNKSIDELWEQVGGGNMAFYEYRNGNVINIDNGGSKQLVRLKVMTTIATKVEIHMEINLNVETDSTANVVATYVINGEEDLDIHPEETYIDGKHVLHLMYIMPMLANVTSYFIVRLSMSNGNATINNKGFWLYAGGLGLVGEQTWDGTIEISEDVTEWSVSDDLTVNGNITENVNRTVKVPIGPDISENAPYIDVTAGELDFASYRDGARALIYYEQFQRVTENVDGATPVVRGTEGTESATPDDIRYTEQEVDS